MRALKIVMAGMLLMSAWYAPAFSAEPPQLCDDDAEWIGCKIFFNECSGRIDRLITWNEGEAFMSLGIGHFIWYPADRRGPFDERFTDFLVFAKENGAELPIWLDVSRPPCPWADKKAFLRDRKSDKVCELRQFLAYTVTLQLRYIVARLQGALPKMLAAVPEGSRPRIKEQFDRMAATPAGMYVLIDYVNCKGEGLLSAERYNGQGWGLLQVLERMTGTAAGMPAIQDFVCAAERLLTERVQNAPPERREWRWLVGWKRRLYSYIEAGCERPGA